MKNTVMITLGEKKVQALKMYLSEKKTSLDEQLSNYAEQLYGKVVPQNVRDFIEMTSKQKNTVKPKNAAAKPNDLPRPILRRLCRAVCGFGTKVG